MRILSLSALLLSAALVGCGDSTTVIIVKSASTATANADAVASTPAADDYSSDSDATTLDAEKLISDTY